MTTNVSEFFWMVAWEFQCVDMMYLVWMYVLPMKCVLPIWYALAHMVRSSPYGMVLPIWYVPPHMVWFRQT